MRQAEVPLELARLRRWSESFNADRLPVTADVFQPFVVDGLGVPKGLSHAGHVKWSETVEHPLATLRPVMDDDFDLAVEKTA